MSNVPDLLARRGACDRLRPRLSGEGHLCLGYKRIISNLCGKISPYRFLFTYEFDNKGREKYIIMRYNIFVR